jgi:hypothetical protein
MRTHAKVSSEWKMKSIEAAKASKAAVYQRNRKLKIMSKIKAAK